MDPDHPNLRRHTIIRANVETRPCICLPEKESYSNDSRNKPSNN